MQAVSRLAILAALVLGFTGHASAQTTTWPSRPVKVIVPFAAGGTVDTLSRYLAVRLGVLLGQPVIIDNRPGAGGNMGNTWFLAMTEQIIHEPMTIKNGVICLPATAGYAALIDWKPLERLAAEH
ncbi:MAG: hypothetical protein JWP77_2366 [Polaromonas sp.]|jgi:tripartite-type tricarboxylate transporter receptor subunit TctC|nr:hypothetical protein [Polaromonas sp.]